MILCSHMNYYIIQVKSLKEDEYIQRIEKRLEFRSKSQAFIFPKRELKIKKNGKTTKQTLPLFSSYIFIQTEEVDRQLYNIMKTTPYFYRFLPNNQSIQKLEGKDLSLIQHFLQFGKTIESSRVIFDENDRIIVKEGPMKGLEGLISKVDRRKKRARIQVELAQTPIIFDLSFDVIEKGGENNATNL